jgi:hypothetical protein
MAPDRAHSIEFTRQMAKQFLGGETLHGLAERHGISRNRIRTWVAKFVAGSLDSDMAVRQMCLPTMRRAFAALERRDASFPAGREGGGLKAKASGNADRMIAALKHAPLGHFRP